MAKSSGSADADGIWPTVGQKLETSGGSREYGFLVGATDLAGTRQPCDGDLGQRLSEGTCQWLGLPERSIQTSPAITAQKASE
jgi:hypothetical protein